MLLPSFFRRVGCSTPTTPRLFHRRHFRLLAYDLRIILLSSLRVPHFPRRRCTNRTVAAGTDFALLGCITTSHVLDACPGLEGREVLRLVVRSGTPSRRISTQQNSVPHVRPLERPDIFPAEGWQRQAHRGAAAD